MQRERKALIGLSVLVILLACSLGYVLAQTPTQPFWVTPGVYPGATGYTVWREGSNRFAKTRFGEIAFSGTNATQVITQAIQASSTTYMTTVKLVGAFTTDSTIHLENFITLDLTEATITLANGVNDDIINATQKHDIRIVGGVLDGNRANQAGTSHGMTIKYCHNVSLEGITVKKALNMGFTMGGGDSEGQNSQNFTITRCTSINNGVDGFYLGARLKQLTVSECKSFDNVDSGFVVVSVQDATFKGNIVKGCVSHGFVLNSLSGSSFHIKNIIVDSNTVTNSTSGSGIIFGWGANRKATNLVLSNNQISGMRYGISTFADSQNHGIVISGNLIHDNDREGILIDDSWNITITGNTLTDNAQAGAGVYSGVYLSANVTHCLVGVNSILGSQQYAIREGGGGSNWNFFHGNLCENGTTDDILVTGGNSVASDNLIIP